MLIILFAFSSPSLRLLEWAPSQKVLVNTARFIYGTAFRIMVGELAPQSENGEYLRPAPQSGTGQQFWPEHLPVVAGRYHIYLGNPCPWCHRVATALQLRGLGEAISVTRLVNDPTRASRGGWCIDADSPDPLIDAPDLKAVYDACSPDGYYVGRCTAPLLIDTQTRSIISNESGDIVRILNNFDGKSAAQRTSTTMISGSVAVIDLYPSELASHIDSTNLWVYEKINNGVYRAGFATRQIAYECAERDVHDGLSKCDQVLAQSRFLCGSSLSEADVWLFPTVARFDGIYAPFFRCGRKLIRSDYPHVNRWLKEMIEFAGPFDLDDARRGYYNVSHPPSCHTSLFYPSLVDSPKRKGSFPTQSFGVGPCWAINERFRLAKSGFGKY